MGCPSCGGNERVPIAVGYWECVALVEERRPGRVPDPMGVVGSTMPAVDIVERPCRVRYHEDGGASTATCACGTFGIGVCAECGSVVCGDHSRLRGQRLCVEHAQIADEAAAEAAAQARLTVEKFLALAAAAGNPGLETWIIQLRGEVPYTYRQGFAKRTGHRVEIVGEREITFWPIHFSYFAEDTADVYVLSPDGRVSKTKLPIRPRGRKILAGALSAGDDFYNYTAEAQDKFFREACRNYGIPV
jgi:hypothetical protein